jgi:hypothetical protein
MALARVVVLRYTWVPAGVIIAPSLTTHGLAKGAEKVGPVLALVFSPGV